MELKHPNLLQDRVAIVTGASGGIGRATAITLAQAGAKVVVAARSIDKLNEVVDEIKTAGGHALAVPTDVSDLAQVDQLVNQTWLIFGPADILVNNAALIQPLDKVWQTAPADWQQLMLVNVVGPYLCARAVLPEMLKRNRGWIVNVSSGAARSDIEGASAYCASKAAMERFSSTLAAEVAGQGVIVTAFRPGVVQSDMQVNIRQTSPEQLPRVGHWLKLHEEGQLRPPVEAAIAILWLASRFATEEANGHLFSIDEEAFRQQIAENLGVSLPGRQR